MTTDGKTFRNFTLLEVFHVYMASICLCQKVAEGLKLLLPRFECFSYSSSRSKWSAVKLRKSVKLTTFILRVMLECVGEYIRPFCQNRICWAGQVFSCALIICMKKSAARWNCLFWETRQINAFKTYSKYSCKKMPLLLASILHSEAFAITVPSSFPSPSSRIKLFSP